MEGNSKYRRTVQLFVLFIALTIAVFLVQYAYTSVQWAPQKQFYAGKALLSSGKSHPWVHEQIRKISRLLPWAQSLSVGNITNTQNRTLMDLGKLTTQKTIITTRSPPTTVKTTTVATTTVKPTTAVPVASGELCPLVPPKLVGPLRVAFEKPTFEELAAQHPELEPGGRYKPKTCTSRFRVAIIIPYRDRPEQLRMFLNHMHPILQRQQLDYGIYAVEPAKPTTFNRGMLMNVGFVEALKLYNYQCFVFHDVDLLPEDDRNIYSCPENPRHMTPAVDKFNYRLPYQAIFGGGSAFKKEHYEKINGFSNKYFGWGGEDDDLWKRVHAKGLKVIRYPMNIARYKMYRHIHEKSNGVNPNRFNLLNTAVQRQATDGLNNMKYEVLKVELKKTYTWVYVKIDQNQVLRS